jgi:hypothetical protein
MSSVRFPLGWDPCLPAGREGHNINGSYLIGKPIRHTQGRELCRTAPLLSAWIFTRSVAPRCALQDGVEIPPCNPPSSLLN